MNKNISLISIIGILLGCLTITNLTYAAPKADLWSKWQAHDEKSSQKIDHSPWQSFLDTYLKTDHPSGVNRVDYKAVSKADKLQLESYLNQLATLKISDFNRQQQKAFWINFYNALTVKVILDHYPVKSILDIDISPGIFSNGPWDAKLTEIEGSKVSLNDMEHRILRPIWKDNRIHYVVNCASIGCPNLSPQAFKGENNEQLLDKAARDYINHPRGVNWIDKDDVEASSIFDWYAVDFGDDEEKVVQHWLRYAEPDLKMKLQAFEGDIDYDYDWNLNQP